MHDRSVAYYDRIAGDYDRQLLERPADLRARAAFLDLVGHYVARGGTLLDFGSGTGLDAHSYVQKGYTVLAFDQSEQMMERLRDRCRGAISSGQVRTTVAPYSRLDSALSDWPPADALVSNFAVLNMIENLGGLFATFARYARRPAWVIVSIVNPTQWKRLLRRVPLTAEYETFAHFPADLVAAADGFDLIGVGYAGRFVRYIDRGLTRNRDMWWGLRDAPSSPLKRLVWASPAVPLAAAFQFLVFRTR
jgi:hypothetical protein